MAHRHGAHRGRSVIVQIASVMFWCPLEIYQMETLGHPTFVIALRLTNILAFSLGKMNQWGLNNDAMKEDPWDCCPHHHLQFLPFPLARVGKAAVWLVQMLTVIWFTMLAALIALLAFIRDRAIAGKN